MNQTATSEEIIKLLDNVRTSMDNAVKSTCDELEESIIKNYRFFGGSDYDVANVQKWLRPMLEAETRKILLEQFKAHIDNKRATQ